MHELLCAQTAEENTFIVMWLSVRDLPPLHGAVSSPERLRSSSVQIDDSQGPSRRSSIGRMFKRSTPTRRRSADPTNDSILERSTIGGKSGLNFMIPPFFASSSPEPTSASATRSKVLFKDKTGTAGTWVDCINRSVETCREAYKNVNRR
jgi:hypothetical protein